MAINHHPHSMATAFEYCNPGEAHIEFVYPPIPVRDYDYQASLYDGEACIGEGRTRELAAISAFEDHRLWAHLKIWEEK